MCLAKTRHVALVLCVLIIGCFHVFVSIVRGVSCVLLGSTEAALMGNFTPISRQPAKRAMKTAWVHSGALRAPLCIQGDVMAHFASRREIGVKF